LMTLLPTGLMALVMGGYFSWQQLRYTEEQLLQRGLMTMEYLQQPAATALLNGDTGQIGNILYNALNYTDVRALTLYDTEMVALEHRGPRMYPAGQPLPNVGLAAGTGLQIQRSSHSSRFMMPLLASADLPSRQPSPQTGPHSGRGGVELELSRGNTELPQPQALRATLMTIVAGLGLTAAVVSRKGRRLTWPILRLHAPINQISQGEFDVR